MIFFAFLDPYPPPVNYLFGKPFHNTLHITETYTETFLQELVNNSLNIGDFGKSIFNVCAVTLYKPIASTF